MLTVVSGAACFLLVGVFVLGEDAAPTYLGAEKCAKMCHKVQYSSWLETRHAKAWESLKAEEQEKEECVSCHRTAEDFVGVQCESCHGPGSDYKKMSVMKDPEKAKAAGLKTPDEAACKTCHNPESPTYKEFNFAESVKKVHEHKTRCKAPAKE
jgi:hypothetical protein